MINRTYNKVSDAGQLMDELFVAGLQCVAPLRTEYYNPTLKPHFYGVTFNSPDETIVHCTDDLTTEEETLIDTVVNAHTPQGL